jgi:hypothetical protein
MLAFLPNFPPAAVLIRCSTLIRPNNDAVRTAASRRLGCRAEERGGCRGKYHMGRVSIFNKKTFSSRNQRNLIARISEIKLGLLSVSGSCLGSFRTQSRLKRAA